MTIKDLWANLWAFMGILKSRVLHQEQKDGHIMLSIFAVNHKIAASADTVATDRCNQQLG